MNNTMHLSPVNEFNYDDALPEVHSKKMEKI